MINVKILPSLTILLTGSLLITACGSFGPTPLRVINLSKTDVPDSNLAIIDSIQDMRLTDSYRASISEALTLYPATVNAFGNHQYKLKPGKQALKIRWEKSLEGTETIWTGGGGGFDEKGRFNPSMHMDMPTVVPTSMPMADHTYTISTVLLPGHIYSVETPLKDESHNNANGSPKRVCIQSSLQNKDKKLLSWKRVGCTNK